METVPVAAGRVSVFEPATAGAFTATVPLEEPLKLTTAVAVAGRSTPVVPFNVRGMIMLPVDAQLTAKSLR